MRNTSFSTTTLRKAVASADGGTKAGAVARKAMKAEPSTMDHKLSTQAKAHKSNAFAEFVYKMVDSPIGGLRLVGNDEGLSAILWEIDDPKRVRLNVVGEDEEHPVLVETARQLGEYFSGKRKVFDLKLNFQGTAFQRKVWEALLRIPFGETKSYGEIARELGNPKAMRAVGAANGKNPIAIIAPCHRVIGASGDLTGFAGGLKAKADLLALEKANKKT